MKSESDLRIEVMLLLCPGLMQRWNQLQQHSADSKLRPLLNVPTEVLMSISEIVKMKSESVQGDAKVKPATATFCR